MAPDLEEDLKSIAEWAEALAGHHRNGLPREALMHGRNLGEAACRVIIRVAWPGRRGEDELRTSQFDLLLRTIQNKALAPPEIVSALHVLRTRGNNALHGRPVSANDSAGALFMLQALLGHLYGTLLQRQVPTAVARAMEQAMGGKAQPGQRNALRDMLREVLREETKSAAPPTAPASVSDTADVRRIEVEQEDHRARIRDMEELVKQLAAREAQAPATSPLPAIAPEPAARTRKFGWPVAAMVLILAVVASVLVTRSWKGRPTSEVALAPDSTVTTVLILPFALMQDNPNMHLRFEQSMEERIKSSIREGKLAMRVFTLDTVISAMPPEDSALAIARRHHADLIFYGELFEPINTDSGRVHIRFISTGEGNWPKGDLGALGFRTLADSGAIRAQLAVQGIAELALANRLYGTGQASAALALLYQVPTVNTDWTVTTHLMRARCHRLAGDLAPAIREMNAAIALAPDNPETLAYMGRVLKENGDRAAAIGFYERAIDHQPRNAPWLLSLAYLLGDRSHPETFDMARVRSLSARAMEADSMFPGSWALHGQILANDGDHPTARAALERAIDLDSTYYGAKYDLASLLLFNTSPADYPKAEKLLRSTIRMDSSNTQAVLLLGKVLTNGPHKDTVLADRLFRKANAADPNLELQVLTSRARAAYAAHQDQKALDLYQELWAKDSSDLTVGVRIAILLQQLGKEPMSAAMLLRCYAIDSMNHGVNLNLGITYSERDTPADRSKAIKHLERALQTDPQDKDALQRLGMALAEDSQYKNAVPILERLLKVDPDNHIGNGYLGSLMVRSGHREKAMHYFEKSLTTDPGDPIVCGNLATLYATLKPPRLADAQMLLERALKEVPDDPSLHMSMYSVLMEEGDFDGAADHYRKAIAVKPQFRSASVEKKLTDHGVW
jgi:tetratricopeptide (TPR) repeat protein